MTEDIGRLFASEVREKRITASGVNGRTGKTGRIGKMVTPADLIGADYKAAVDGPNYSFLALLKKLNESPALKSVLMERLDQEHRNYRLAIERTLDAVGEIMLNALEPVTQQLDDLTARVSRLEQSPLAETADVNDPAEFGALDADLELEGTRTASGRIRWGKTPEEIRHRVLEELRRLEREGKEVCIKTLREELPSCLRWLYGKTAVFNGLGDAKEAMKTAGT
ncbi:MAG: hypothetical protein AB1331_04595 [Bacillota bacterium]